MAMTVMVPSLVKNSSTTCFHCSPVPTRTALKFNV